MDDSFSGVDLHMSTVCVLFTLRNFWSLLFYSVFFFLLNFPPVHLSFKVRDSLNYHASAPSSSELSENHFHSSVSLRRSQAYCICERTHQWQKRVWASVSTLKTSDKELVITTAVLLSIFWLLIISNYAAPKDDHPCSALT